MDIIKPLIEEKAIIYSGMRQERDRCERAIELASSGKPVALVSGGDPGIYGMAGLVFEIASSIPPDRLPSFEVIPGIAALNACASRLGAPLMHDFASISLSDILTPWEVIEKRLVSASSADFVIILYNPKSKGRKDQIVRARDIIMEYRSGETPVGIVRQATKQDESCVIATLNTMLRHEIDMKSTVIVGNGKTFVWQGHMITPRGYGCIKPLL